MQVHSKAFSRAEHGASRIAPPTVLGARWLVRVGLVLLCWMVPTWAAARVYRPVATPATVHARASVDERVGVRIGAGSARVGNVQAWLQIDGEPREVVASLHDDGRDGDLHAGDGFYGALLRVSEPQPVVREYRVSAEVEGERDPWWSEAFSIEALDERAPVGSAPPDFERLSWDRDNEVELACDGLLLYAAKGADIDSVEMAADSVDGRLVGVAAMSDGNAWNVEVPCSDADTLHALTARLQQSAVVEGAEVQPRGEFFGVPIDDPLVVGQAVGSAPRWVETAGHTRAWNITKGARNFTPMIAIIDSGVDYRHDDLVGRITLGRDFVGINDNDPMDEYGHGTATAGVAGAIANNGIGIAGGAPSARLLAVRISNQFPTIDHMCDGIENALEHGASILNLSFGTSIRSRRLAECVHQATAAGALSVAGVGNKLKNKRFYPGAFEDTEYFGVNNRIAYHPHVIGVGAIDTQGQLDLFNAVPNQPGSNYGSWVDVSTYALTFAPFLDNDHIGSEGTSVATPIVASAAALVWSVDASLSADDVRALLLGSTQRTGFNDPAGNPLRALNTLTAVVRAVVPTCSSCSGGVAAIHPDLFPSAGVRFMLGFTGATLPNLRAFGTQAASVHGFAVPLLPRVSPVPVPFSAFDLSYSATLRTFDAYNSSAGFFDLFSASLGAPYFNLNLVDDIRPNLNAWFTAGGPARLSQDPTEIDIPLQTAGLSTSALLPFLSVVLDTRTLPNSDTAKPSWGIVVVHDLTPQAFE